MAQQQLSGENPRYERWRWQIFAITWLAYAGFYLTRKSFSVAKIELAKPAVMGLSKADMSWMDGANSVAYALGQFGWGMLGDKAGTRRVIILGMLVSVIAAMLSGASNTVLFLGALLTVQGLVQASGWAPLAKNIGEFFSQRERGRVMGWWCTNYAFGGFIASSPAALAVRWGGGWRYAFWAPALGLLLIWVLFIAFQRNRPEDAGLPAIENYHGETETVAAPTATPDQEAEGSWTVIAEVLGSPMVWLLAAVYFLVKPTRYLILYWSPVYVNERLGTGTTESGILGSMFDLAGPLGTLAGGYLSDRVFQSRRMPVGILALVTLAILMITFQYLPLTKMAIAGGFFVAGFLIYIPDSLISGTAAIDFGTKKGASTASGIVNGCGSIGQIIGVTLPGWVGKLLGQGHEIWNPIFFGLGLALALAALLLVPHWHRLPAVNLAAADKAGARR
jgi:OPA family sugar phosphate sensor protein UhpC-like MFS transporter